MTIGALAGSPFSARYRTIESTSRMQAVLWRLTRRLLAHENQVPENLMNTGAIGRNKGGLTVSLRPPVTVSFQTDCDLRALSAHANSRMSHTMRFRVSVRISRPKHGIGRRDSGSTWKDESPVLPQTRRAPLLHSILCPRPLPLWPLPDPLVHGRNLIRSIRVKTKGFLVRFDRESIFSPSIEASLEEFDT